MNYINLIKLNSIILLTITYAHIINSSNQDNTPSIRAAAASDSISNYHNQATADAPIARMATYHQTAAAAAAASSEDITNFHRRATRAITNQEATRAAIDPLINYHQTAAAAARVAGMPETTNYHETLAAFLADNASFTDLVALANAIRTDNAIGTAINTDNAIAFRAAIIGLTDNPIIAELFANPARLDRIAALTNNRTALLARTTAIDDPANLARVIAADTAAATPVDRESTTATAIVTTAVAAAVTVGAGVFAAAAVAAAQANCLLA